MKFRLPGTWFRQDDLDEDFLASYRTTLVGQYNSLNNPINDPRAKEEGDKIVKIPADKIEWEDLYSLELAIIKLEPTEQLRRRAWVLRSEYQEVASANEFKAYMASEPPDAIQAKDMDLRADLIRLQEELNWKYIVIWVLEAFRSHITRKVVTWTVGVLAVGFLVLTFDLPSLIAGGNGRIDLAFLGLVVLPGVIGGLISTVRRLQTVRLDGNADLDLSQLEKGNTSTLLSPFLGGIFALILFLLFTGEFVTGHLFPKVSFELLTAGIPEEYDFGEIPKLVVWCFIAGFAEKFVPDRLDQLAEQAAQNDKGSAQGPRKKKG